VEEQQKTWYRWQHQCNCMSFSRHCNCYCNSTKKQYYGYPWWQPAHWYSNIQRN